MDKKKTILIIEDNETILENITDFLQTEGFNTLKAENGAEGIQKALRFHPDLIVSDIEMPEMDGFELFKMLQQIPTLSDTPFIFLTARTQMQDFRLGMQMGADDYICKPFQFSELLGSINRRFKKLEKIDKKAENQLENLYDNPFIAVFMVVDNQIRYFNDKFSTIFNINPKDKNSLTVGKVFVSNYFDEFKQGLSQCILGILPEIKGILNHYNDQKKHQFIEYYLKSTQVEGLNGVICFFSDVVSKMQVDSEFQNKFPDKIPNSLKEEKLWAYKTDNEDSLNAVIKELIENTNSNNIEKANELMTKLQVSEREIEILKLICEGYTNAEIGEKLFISPRTVDGHRNHLLEKTSTRNTAALVAFAYKHHIIT